MVQKGSGSQNRSFFVELRIDIEELEEALIRADDQMINATDWFIISEDVKLNLKFLKETVKLRL